MSSEGENDSQLRLKPIGNIRTPYIDHAPFQPVERCAKDGDFCLVLNHEYIEGLKDLSSFNYIYVIFFMDRRKSKRTMLVSPPWAGGKEVGLFASRSPNRPNPIGISIARLLRIEKNVLFTSPLDVLDNTPLLDIKPYIKVVDSKEDANCGWIDELSGTDELIRHVRGTKDNSK